MYFQSLLVFRLERFIKYIIYKNLNAVLWAVIFLLFTVGLYTSYAYRVASLLFDFM